VIELTVNMENRDAHDENSDKDIKQHSEFHLIKADPSEAADLVDRDFELWLPGLREYVAGQATNAD